MTRYVDWLVIMVALILTLQVSFVICLLVYLVELLKKVGKDITSEKSEAS
jgi:hypothetical protein